MCQDYHTNCCMSIAIFIFYQFFVELFFKSGYNACRKAVINMLNKTELGKNIRNKREEKGLYQSELAKCLGVTAQAISSWEAGRTEPKFAMCIKLADALNCTVSDLLYGETQTEISVDYEIAMPDDEKVFIEAYRQSDQASRLTAYAELLKGIKKNDN